MPSGTFILADIGGYSTFLTDVGIEHAKEITSHLFDSMFEACSDTWSVGNVQGDCLFLYADQDIRGEELASGLHTMYAAFRRALEVVVGGSTCRCGACERSGDLSLKFVVHAGEFDVHEVVGRRELIGPDIVVAHRLLKNTVPVREYALFTSELEGCAAHLDQPSVAGCDTYDDIGSVEHAYVDFAPIREAFLASRVVFVAEADADVTARIDIDAPAELVWAAINDPAQVVDIFPTLLKIDPLVGPLGDQGTTHTCLHGDTGEVVHYRIVTDDEQRMATDRLLLGREGPRILMTWAVDQVDARSVVRVHYLVDPEGPEPNPDMRAAILAVARRHAEADVVGIKTYCEAAALGSATTRLPR